MAITTLVIKDVNQAQRNVTQHKWNWRGMKTIHMVDDDPIDSFVLRLNTKRLELDWHVLSYTDGTYALNQLKNSRATEHEVILVDIHMPGLSGFEFVDAFASLPNAARTNRTLCIASGTQDAANKTRAADHPAITAFLSKPIDPLLIEKLFIQ